jgi:ammonia channel protein AmtB
MIIAVGAVAVHGYAGFAGLVICGFVLWGHPSSVYEGYAAINPLGQFLGAIVMFGVLGFLPGWIIAKILAGAGMLRIPKEVELLGLDFASNQEQKMASDEVRETQKNLV